MSNSAVWNIRDTYKKIQGGTLNQKGDTGIVMGGRTPASTNINSIEKLQLSTSGSAADYGDLTVARSNMSSNAGGNFIRTFAVGGTDPSNSNVIDTVLFSSSGGATNFGDLSAAAYGQAAHSDNIRLVTPQGDGRNNVINYITMATEGNSADFGDCTNSVIEKGTTGSTTRLITAGGTDSPTTQVNTIQYLTIQSLGNASDFGDLNFTPRNTAGASNGVRGCFAGGLQFYGAPSPLNSAFNNIDYVTIASTGNATDFGDLTNSVYGATGMSNSASGRGYFAGGATYPANVPGSTIDTITIATAGNATDFGDLTQAQYLGSGGTNAHGGLEVGAPRPYVIQSPTQKIVPSGFGLGDIGIFNGGEAPGSTNVADYIQISNLGNAIDWGDLARTNANGEANANSTRYVTGGDFNADLDTYYVEFATKGNFAYFGDLTVQKTASATGGSSTRGINYSGVTTPGTVPTNVIEYITFSTIGNFTDFGDADVASYFLGTANSSTRVIKSGGISTAPATYTNSIEYITTASTGNGTDFGDLLSAISGPGIGVVSNSTRGVFGGGGSPVTNVIQYVTMASTGNSTDFGDLTVARFASGSACNSTRGVFAGGETPTNSNVMDYITIAATGNATDFGDLTISVSRHGGNSNGHGGLS